jgi:phosphate transport system substrate-binding protein
MLYHDVEGRITMNRIAQALILELILAMSLGCSPGHEANARNLVITGSQSMAPLVQEMGKRFEAGHPGVRINVQRSGTDQGIIDTRNGLADVGMAARPLRPDETPLQVFPIARDGIGLLVYAENPIKELSDEQVGRIFSRAYTNWKLVGGKDEPIFVVAHAENRAIHQVFLEYFKIKGNQGRADLTVADSASAIQAVSGQRQAIAYVSLGPAEAAIKAGAPVRLLPLGGVAATEENVRNGSYPLVRPLNLLTRESPNGLTREFLDFAQSAEVQDVVRKLQWVSPRR